MSQSAEPNVANSPESKAKMFLAQAEKFKLGHLPTEMQHPRTTRLSQMARDDLSGAIALLKDVELEAIRCLLPKLTALEEMSDEIQATLKEGGRIFLCGCGATGRLSLSLETVWHEETDRIGRTDLSDKVISFMAGGDYALVRSIENFEDHPEYGVRQLHDLGFTIKDLMIGCTEGGETPFVIGAVQEAAQIARRKPFFLFCNPPELLSQTVERSRQTIEHPRIRSISLETGPMALAGSTRLQATTALMLATGCAMFATLERPARPRAFIDEFMTCLRSTDFSALKPLIETERDIYARGDYCLHRTARYGMTVLTDTTERSPTFSLRPFENNLTVTDPLAWTYLCHQEAKDTADSWQKILGRTPRPITWPGFDEKFGQRSLAGFDFSRETLKRRERAIGPERQNVYDVECGARDFTLHLSGLQASFMRPASLLVEHLLLKCALNISSTLAMGLLGRFSGNLMLYVRPANNKLVDRAIRYIQILLSDAGVHDISYEKICVTLFQTSAGLSVDEPAVLRTFERLQGHSPGIGVRSS